MSSTLWTKGMGSKASGCGTSQPPATRKSCPRRKADIRGLTFSPNGDFLYFVRGDTQHQGVGFLYQIPVLGGTPRKLVDDVDSAVSFSPDGQQIVFLRDSSTDASSTLIIAHADGSG